MFGFRQFLAAALLFSGIGLSANGQDSEQAAKNAARAAMVRRIDELVAARIKDAGYEPAAAASDEEFLRRVHVDLSGAIPRVSETREFLADAQPDKRARLIDSLLSSPGHATHLANTWRNIMLPGGLNLEQI